MSKEATQGFWMKKKWQKIQIAKNKIIVMYFKYAVIVPIILLHLLHRFLHYQDNLAFMFIYFFLGGGVLVLFVYGFFVVVVFWGSFCLFFGVFFFAFEELFINIKHLLQVIYCQSKYSYRSATTGWWRWKETRSVLRTSDFCWFLWV